MRRITYRVLAALLSGFAASNALAEGRIESAPLAIDGGPAWPKADAAGVMTLPLGGHRGTVEIPHLATLRFFDEWMQRAQ